MSRDPSPTLTDKRGMGGIIAQDGFEYQIWDALARLPEWLRDAAFEGLIVEGIEDVEARFLAPHANSGRVVDRFQAKSGTLSASDVEAVCEAFAQFDRFYPGHARRHVLVTPALPRGLEWMARDSRRVKNARPFYAPFRAVLKASDEKLAKDFADQLGETLGPAVAASVDFDLRPTMDRRVAEALFASEWNSAFPEVDLSGRQVGELFASFSALLQERRGRLVHRHELLDLADKAAGREVLTRRILPIVVRSAEGGDSSRMIEIDGTPFSDFSSGVPRESVWRENLLTPMRRLESVAHRNFDRVRLAGSFRISTALCIGSIFRAVRGYEIDLETRDGIWSTDERVGDVDATPPWQVTEPSRPAGPRLTVVIGVLRDPLPDVLRHGQVSAAHQALHLQLNQAVENAVHIQSSVRLVKDAVARAVAKGGVSGIDLFFAGPASLAVALGHRWNGMPSTQLHEFRPGDGYAPSAILD